MMVLGLLLPLLLSPPIGPWSFKCVGTEDEHEPAVAEELILRAPNGQGSLRLGFEQGQPGIWLYDQKGALAAALEVAPERSGSDVRLGLYDPRIADGEEPLLELSVFREKRSHHGICASLRFLGGGEDGTQTSKRKALDRCRLASPRRVKRQQAL